MPIPLGVLAVAGAGAAGGGNSFDLLETTLITTNTASVTFSNLNTYSAYKHLQIRFLAKNTNTSDAAPETLAMRFNSDTGSNYAFHALFGNGSSVTSNASTTRTAISAIGRVSQSSTSTIFAAGVIDVLDFSNSSKNTTVRSLGGINSSSSVIELRSGFWNNTAAVTSILLYDDGGRDFVSGSRFSLYGIK